MSSILGKLNAYHYFFTIKAEFNLREISSHLCQPEIVLTSIKGIHRANNPRSISASQFLPDQMMCASCHMNTVQTVRERETEIDKERKRERDPHRPRCCSPLQQSFPSNCVLDSLWTRVPGPGADDWYYPSSLIYPHLRTKLPQQLDQRQRLWGGGERKSRTTHSLTWIQAGNSLMVETLHLFPLDLPARSTQMESGLGERERTDGQTHKQRADSTPHSQSQSHYREVGSRDWRCNNTFWMPSAFNKVNILNMLASRVQSFWNGVHFRSFGCHKNCNRLEISWLVKVILDQAYIYP